MDLHQQTCIPCRGDEAPLTSEELKNYHSAVPEWNLEEKLDSHPQITRAFTLKNFQQVIDFVTEIAKIAETEGHHPNLYIHEYKNLNVEIYTHKTKGLHINDFILASKIDHLWKKYQP